MAAQTLPELVTRALVEDVGDGDVTTRAVVPDGARARAEIVQKEPGVLYGLDAAELTFRSTDPEVRLERLAPEGEWREGGPVLAAEGTAAGLLAAERVALNFLGRLSGIATLTALCVRALEKAAVRAGGGRNHRAGLYDEILIKENHAALAGGVGEAVRRARAAAPELPLEVECRTPEQIDEALAAGVRRILLDNMSVEELRAAVARVDGRAALEASGGFTLDALGEIGSVGLQFVSIGALTHSARALDLSLVLRPLP